LPEENIGDQDFEFLDDFGMILTKGRTTKNQSFINTSS